MLTCGERSKYPVVQNMNYIDIKKRTTRNRLISTYALHLLIYGQFE